MRTAMDEYGDYKFEQGVKEERSERIPKVIDFFRKRGDSDKEIAEIIMVVYSLSSEEADKYLV